MSSGLASRNSEAPAAGAGSQSEPHLSQAGSAAIYGFLYQLAGSLDALLGAHFARSGSKVDPDTIVAVIEPRAGADLTIQTGQGRIAYQFKHRSTAVGRGDLIHKVLPDLYRAHSDRACSSYILQTTNGVSRPASALARRLVEAGRNGPRQAWLDDPDMRAIAARCRPIHGATGASSETFERDLASFFARFVAAEPLSLARAQAGVVAWLQRSLAYSEKATDRLDQLVGYLIGRAKTNDAVISVDDLRARLGLARSDDAAADTVLNRMLDRLAASLGKRDYDPALDVREPLAVPEAAITIVVGASGQGKSWSLYRTASALLHARHPAVLVRASSRADLERQLQRIIAVDGLQLAEPVQVPLLGATWQRQCGTADRIAILWEGCRNAADLDAIDLEGGLGAGLALVAEYPVGVAGDGNSAAFPSHRVGDFTPIQLFKALERRGVDAGLVPRNIRAMLHRPVLCGIYSRLALEMPGWDPQNEYRVLEAFWTRARDRAGAYATVRLKALARLLVETRRAYTTDDEMAALGFTTGELEELLAAGWLSNLGTRWSFAHDRLLTWAISEALAFDFGQRLRSAADLIDIVKTLNAAREKASDTLAGLGFLLMDVVWQISADAARADEIAAFLAGFEDEESTGPWELYRSLLPTIGPRIIPVLVARIKRLGADDGHMAIHIVAALRQVMGDDRAKRDVLLDELWAHASEHSIDVALTLANGWPFHAHRDRLWTDYCTMSAERESDRYVSERFDAMDAALRTIVCDAPDWLTDLVESERSADEYRIAAYFLKSLDVERGNAIWSRTRDRLFGVIAPERQSVLIECIDRFGDERDAGVLALHALSDRAWASKAVATWAKIDPGAVLDYIEALPPLAPIPPGRDWMDRLFDYDGDRTRTALQQWREAGDSTGGELAALFSRAEDRVDDALVSHLLAKLADIMGAPFGEGRRDPFASLVALLGSLTLDPRHDPLFEAYRGSDFAARICARAMDHVNRNSDERQVAVRRILRRIGGSDYESLVLHTLSHDDLGKSRAGIAMSIFAPTPPVVARLEELTSVGTSEGDATEVRLSLWRVLLAVEPERWRPRLMALTKRDTEEDVAFALRLLPEYEEAGDQAFLLESLRGRAPGSKIEAMLLNAAAVAGPSDPDLTARALARLATDDDEAGRLGALNTLLKDKSPEARAIFDTYLARLGNAKSWKSYDSEALVIRLGQGGASEALWAIGERVGGRGFWSADDFVEQLVDKDEVKALNILLERAFSEPDFITNVQPDAIATLARIDKDRATQAFRQAWIGYPDRRRSMARAVRAVDSRALEAMVDALDEDRPGSGDRYAYRAACVELRIGHTTIKPYLMAQFAAADAERKEALVEAIGWMPDGPHLLTGLLETERDRHLRDKLYEVRRVWLDAAAAAEQFRQRPSLVTMEFALDVCEPEPTYMRDDPLRIIDQINIDPQLTYFAEQQLARRLNDLTKSNLKRVRVRARRPDD
jgi:hypothetical protein